MSYEFDNLTTYSRLPQIAESDLADVWLIEAGGTHCDETESLRRVQARIDHYQYAEGVLPLIVHAKAEPEGRRFIGDMQVMGHYPGDWNGKTVEDRVAAGISWLTRNVRADSLMIDNHNNTNLTYGCVMDTTVKQTLAAAYILGLDDIWIKRGGPYNAAYRNALVYETQVHEDDQSQPIKARNYNEAVTQIIALGIDGLVDLYDIDDVGDAFTFYEMGGEIYLVDPLTKEPQQHTLSVLPELEALCDETEAGKVTSVPRHLRQHFGFPPDTDLYVYDGRYNNLAPPVTNESINATDDRRRRMVFGDFLIPAAPPEPQSGSTLVFRPRR